MTAETRQRPLTAKQAAYRDARVSGLEPSAAYRAAYNAERMSAKAISVEAAALEHHPSVSLAISEARKVSPKALVTREMVINGLLELAQASEGVPAAVRRSAWRDLGEHLAMFKLVVNHERIEELARSLGLDPAEVQAEADAILKGAR